MKNTNFFKNKFLQRGLSHECYSKIAEIPCSGMCRSIPIFLYKFIAYSAATRGYFPTRSRTVTKPTSLSFPLQFHLKTIICAIHFPRIAQNTAS